MNKKMIFYTFIPFEESRLNRAYNVRIYYLIKAFENLGYYVYLIDGFYEDRLSKIKEIWKLIEKGEKIEFVYAELPNLPFLLTSKYRLPLLINNYDIKFLKFLKKNKLRIGFFLRDLHHLTDALDNLGVIKKNLYIFFFNLSLILLINFIDVFFVPTSIFKDFFCYIYKIDIKKVFELSPGLFLDNNKIKYFYERKNKKMNDNILNLIYVGGMYNNLELFKCFEDFYYNNIKNIFLYFITRKEEFIKDNYYINISLRNDLIKIIEANNKDLEFYYDQVDISLLFFKTFKMRIKINNHHDFGDYMYLAFPVKFMEYLGNLKPVITYKEAFVSKIV
ncbi:MAG: hypothetical protein ACP5RD_07305, partial [bacterium]